jgi:hypothetical protein
MSRSHAYRLAREQNRNEHTSDYFAHYAGASRWQVLRREAGGRSPTLIAP